MPPSQNKSAFVPLLVMGALFAIGMVVSLSVPLLECSIDKGKLTQGSLEGDVHFLFAKQVEDFLVWQCRDCGPGGKSTLLQRLISREDGTPPPDAQKLVFDAFKTD